MNSQTDRETERILDEYARRKATLPADFYALHRPANLFNYQGLQRAVLSALATAGQLPLSERRILDVGCGGGPGVGMFELFGASRHSISGIELNPEHLAVAQQRFSGADLRLGNAAELPWSDGLFDIVFQATMFTSILEPRLKQSIAAEMLRVLRGDGVVLWYDFHFNNPQNPNVRGIGRRELAALFPNCQIHLRRVTLAPPLARRLVPLSWPAARLLEQLRFLNTHYLATIRKRA
jgi:SAM-dependent methyltransferase